MIIHYSTGVEKSSVLFRIQAFHVLAIFKIFQFVEIKRYFIIFIIPVEDYVLSCTGCIEHPVFAC